jgi:hypothetical protein
MPFFLEEGMMAEEDMIMARQGELKRLHVIEKVLEEIVKQAEALRSFGGLCRKEIESVRRNLVD